MGRKINRGCPAGFATLRPGPWRWQEFRRVGFIPHPAAFTHWHYFDRVGCLDETFRVAMDYEHFLRANAGLRPQFVSLAPVGMGAGGRCVNNLVDTLQEFR
jgi:hypothetical protein